MRGGGREALFCLGEKTRPERRARKLSVCLLETHALLTPHVLRPATLSYIFVVRAPFLFAPAPTKYEGRFAGVLRVKTRYRIGGASATAVTSLLYRFRVLPAPRVSCRRCRRAVARKDVSDTCRKFPCILAPVREILLTWGSSLTRASSNLGEKARWRVRIIKIQLLTPRLTCHSGVVPPFKSKYNLTIFRLAARGVSSPLFRFFWDLRERYVSVREPSLGWTIANLRGSARRKSTAEWPRKSD